MSFLTRCTVVSLAACLASAALVGCDVFVDPAPSPPGEPPPGQPPPGEPPPSKPPPGYGAHEWADSLPACSSGSVSVLADADGDFLSLSLDDDNVYYGSPQGPRVVSKGGGASRLLAAAEQPTQVVDIAVDAGTMYWSGSRGLSGVSTKGGAAVQLAEGYVQGLAAKGGYVYFLTSGQPGDGVWRWSQAGGVEQLALLDRGVLSSPRLVVDDEALYFVPLATASDTGLRASRLALAGGEVQPFFSSSDIVRGFTVADGYFFYTNQNSKSVKRIAAHGEGGAADTIAEFQGYPVGIAADDTHLYVILEDLDEQDYSGRVVRMGHDGGGVCHFAEPAAYSRALAVDEQAVYWAGGKSLLRALKLSARATGARARCRRVPQRVQRCLICMTPTGIFKASARA